MDLDLLGDAQLVLDVMDDYRWDRRWSYYSGDHPRVYLSAKLMELFRGLTEAMNDNYCGLAVDSRVSRLEVQSWDGDGAQTIWDASRLPQRQDRLFRWALAYGTAPVMLEDPGDGWRIRPNRPTRAVAIEDDEDPGTYRLGAKRWVDEQGHHLTLYYPDAVLRFLHPPAEPGRVDPRRYEPDPEDPGGVNPLGAVPFVMVSPFGDGQNLIDRLSAAQDRINKITSNKMVAGEFTVFAQRVFFTRQSVDPYEVRQTPDHAIVLDPGDTDAKASVQQLPAGSIDGYVSDRNDEVDNLFTLASLPRHLRVNPGTPPSGAAIKADEGPFVEALTDNQREIGEALTTLYGLIGIETEPIWKPVEVNDDAQSTTSFAQVVGAGVPWQIAARVYLDWDEDTIAEAQELADERQAQAATIGAAALTQVLSNPTVPAEAPPGQAPPPPAEQAA